MTSRSQHFVHQGHSLARSCAHALTHSPTRPLAHSLKHKIHQTRVVDVDVAGPRGRAQARVYVSRTRGIGHECGQGWVNAVVAQRSYGDPETK